MEWWQTLLIILVGLLGLMLMRVPVAFAFITVNIVAAFFLWGGSHGESLLIKSIEDSLTTFALAPIPFFILMGEVMFHTGIAPRMIETIDRWFGRIPGRLSLLSIGAGTILSTLTGSTMASTAMLGSTLVPEMERRNYGRPMSIGPILGAGGLAVLIPPSSLGVLLASMGQISIGSFMVAILIPGILLALIMAAYIILRAKLQPHLAPAYQTESHTLQEKLKATAIYILPLGFIVFLVLGLMFLGVATPTEAAAMGAVGSMILALFYKQLNWKTIMLSMTGTMKISVMILMIVAGSNAFGQILSFSGATRNLVKLVTEIHLAPIIILIAMLVLVIIMGTFMESLSILMIVLPIFMPIIHTLHFDPLWFATMLLITIELGTISPPFGTGLFVMKAVAPKGTTMKQLYAATIPFILLDLLLVVIVMVFPDLATWLPSFMKQ